MVQSPSRSATTSAANTLVAVRRGGVLTVIIIAIILAILGFGLMLKVLSGGAYRETDVLISHMRALSVGESMYGEVVARLSATSWTSRWFKDAPDAQGSVAIAGGLADYLIQDARTNPPPPTATAVPTAVPGTTAVNQADLMVRATYEGHSVLMYWRLTCPEDSIDALSRVVPALYMNPPLPPGSPGARPDLPPSFIDEVEKQIATREINRKQTDPLLSPIRDSQNPGEVQGVLGFTPSKPIADNTLVNNPAGPETGVGDPPSTVPIASVPPPAAITTPSVPPLSSPPPAGPPTASSGSGPSGNKWIDWIKAIQDYIARKKAEVAAAQQAAAARAAQQTASGSGTPHGNWDGRQGRPSQGHDHGHSHRGQGNHDHWHPYGHHY